MRKTLLALLLACASLAVASCSKGAKFVEDIPPANENTPTAEVQLMFDWPSFDNVEGRHDKCKYFDGRQNFAKQVVVNIFEVDPNTGGRHDIMPVQSYLDGKDFFGSNPNGLYIDIPREGGFFMDVTVYGEPDPDCCPGPPPGRPVFIAHYGYHEWKLAPIYALMPPFDHCLGF